MNRAVLPRLILVAAASQLALDLALGDGFAQLATTTEVNQNIALGPPTPPPGTCAD